MSDPVIPPDVFAHLVDLAALDLTPEEAEYLRGEMNEQLKVIHELAAIEAGDDVPITSHGVPYTPEIRPALREDAARACEEAEDILAQAPQVENGYIVVPDIPTEELS